MCNIFVLKHNVERLVKMETIHLSEESKFDIKTYELCEFKSGYFLNFGVYTAAGSGVNTGINMEDNLKSSKIVSILLNLHSTKGTHCGWITCITSHT
jgi:hypothetical protein